MASAGAPPPFPDPYFRQREREDRDYAWYREQMARNNKDYGMPWKIAAGCGLFALMLFRLAGII